MTRYWLMKAEPDSRIEKGKDVKFSVNDFEEAGTTSWEGVRNAEARNLMKDMKVGDQVLFYHSNCKLPGIAGFAEICKEAHPDYTAWDTTHPYYDSKTDKNSPKWYMVDVKFSSRAKHFVPLALMRYIADVSGKTPAEEIEYIGEEGIAAIKSMALVGRGRLSVQKVEKEAWDAVEKLSQTGGWDGLNFKGNPAFKGKSKSTRTGGSKSKAKSTINQELEADAEKGSEVPVEKPTANSKKRKADTELIDPTATREGVPVRRSTRSKR